MSKRILVVEGQKDNRQIIRDVLAGSNYEMRRPRTASRHWRLWRNSDLISY